MGIKTKPEIKPALAMSKILPSMMADVSKIRGLVIETEPTCDCKFGTLWDGTPLDSLTIWFESSDDSLCMTKLNNVIVENVIRLARSGKTKKPTAAESKVTRNLIKKESVPAIGGISSEYITAKVPKINASMRRKTILIRTE